MCDPIELFAWILQNLVIQVSYVMKQELHKTQDIVFVHLFTDDAILHIFVGNVCELLGLYRQLSSIMVRSVN